MMFFSFTKRQLQERQFLVASLLFEFLVSTSFYILRIVYMAELSPGEIFLALFLRSQLTNTVTVALIFLPKLWYQHKQVRWISEWNWYPCFCNSNSLLYAWIHYDDEYSSLHLEIENLIHKPLTSSIHYFRQYYFYFRFHFWFEKYDRKRSTKVGFLLFPRSFYNSLP